MKTLTKIFAMALTLMMVMSLATVAFAAKITIDDGEVVTGAEYGAYKLLNATDLGDGKFNYTVNEKYLAVLQTVTGKTTIDDILAHIDALKGNADNIQDFADDVYANIKSMDPDYTTTTNVFSDVAQGYYLIVETKTGAAPGYTEDSFSLVMLDTAGQDEITIETKEELPTSEKKVKDINDTTGEYTKDNDTDEEEAKWIDSADYDIGDAVPFRITFTLPQNFAEYENYFVGIHDVQAEGLTFNEESLKVTVNGDDEKDLTDKFTYTAVAANACEDKACTFHIQCSDIIAAATAESITLEAGDTIVFEYTSTLNDKAVLGSTGNPNEMTIEFSNNPYGDGTSETPWDRVIVFTFKVSVDKYTTVNGEEVNLPGARFTLYKEVNDSTTEGAKTGATIKSELATANSAIKASALKDEAYYVIAAEVEVDEDGDTFGFKGVDDGNYVLVETVIPAGYNAWDAEEFTITAEHDVENADPQLTKLEGGELFTGNLGTCTLSGKVENKSGIELPETGGIGTTIFYIVGSLLAVAAVVLLVTKKRMNSAE
ncbi:MAG: isopeptide-forming domain-containing fimbrial protein [Clostridia bacterium]|nr:isopeptide-forming domain-containing fimbrial protein [Clostridia bacterium]